MIPETPDTIHPLSHPAPNQTPAPDADALPPGVPGPAPDTVCAEGDAQGRTTPVPMRYHDAIAEDRATTSAIIHNFRQERGDA